MDVAFQTADGKILVVFEEDVILTSAGIASPRIGRTKGLFL